MIADKPYLKQISIRSDDVATETFPFMVPAVQEMGTLEFHPDVTFFVGENGSGKSTVLEAIAIAMGFSPEGGTKNARFETAKTTSILHEFLRLSKSFKQPKDAFFFRAESFFNLATYVDEIGMLGGYGDESLHSRSHGEAFMVLLTQKLRGEGFYLFDEPEAALSPTRQLAALSVIHQLVQQNSQFIIATHSPILLSYPRSKIYQFDETGIHEVLYEDTEHFCVTKDFLNNYPRRLEQLLSTEND